MKKNDNKYKYIFYLVGVIVLIFFHSRYNLSYGDVADIYGKILVPGSTYFPEGSNILSAICNFTVNQYKTWSSRSVIEAVMISIGVLPHIVWHILDIFLIMLLAYSIDSVVPIKNKKLKYGSIFLLLMMYPMYAMRSAGYIATTMNYSWVICMGAYVFSVVFRIRKGGESIGAISYIASLLLGLYAFNHEQFCLISLIVLSAIIAKDIYMHKLNRLLVPYWVLCLFEFLYIVTCPGNRNRLNEEISAYAPEFANYTIFKKLEMGTYSLLRDVFGEGGVLLALFILAVFTYFAFIQKKKPVVKVLCIIAILYLLTRSLMRRLLDMDGLVGEIFDIQSKLGFLVGIFALVAIGILCIIYTWSMEERFVLWAAFLGGIGSKVMLGFSLAVIASSERTSIYFWFIRMIMILLVMSKYEDDIKITKSKLFEPAIISSSMILFLYQILFIGHII